ncbi:MAG TPA: TauD/TfdA family dioxygenase [Acidimicrobiia bacterium]|nr:TauD/TfdA family dioxygenase [Acidimicrobiia bacterium]
MLLTTTPLTSSIGAVVENVNLRDIGDADAGALRAALGEHGVLVFRQQDLTREQQVDATARFGAVHGHPVPEFLFGTADPVSVVENDADKLPLEDQQFHVDYSFSTEIPDLAVLHAEVIPPNGGDTMWSNAGAAYDALSSRMREFLEGLTARHDAGDKFWWEMRRTLGEEPSEKAREHFQGNNHPVVCAHPVTGRKVLFVNPGYTVEINELRRTESTGLLRMLFDHLNNPAFHYRHRWSESDVVIWDEHLTAHMGPFDFAPHHRRLARVTAGSSAPVAA